MQFISSHVTFPHSFSITAPLNPACARWSVKSQWAQGRQEKECNFTCWCRCVHCTNACVIQKLLHWCWTDKTLLHL